MKRITFKTAKLADAVFPNQAVELDYTVTDVDGKVYFTPYQAELQEWLRDEHGIHVIVGYRFIPNYSAAPRYGKPTFECEIQVFKQTFNEGVFEGEDDIIRVQDTNGLSFDTYEEALETGLFEGLKILIEKK